MMKNRFHIAVLLCRRRCCRCCCSGLHGERRKCLSVESRYQTNCRREREKERKRELLNKYLTLRAWRIQSKYFEVLEIQVC